MHGTALGGYRVAAVAARPTVCIVSDVRLYREGLSWNLTHEGSLEVVGASGLSSIPAASLEAQAPDAIIFDITMRDGLQLARALHARLPDAKIVAFAVSRFGITPIVIDGKPADDTYVYKYSDGRLTDPLDRDWENLEEFRAYKIKTWKEEQEREAERKAKKEAAALKPEG